jgi:shikimate kinase
MALIILLGPKNSGKTNTGLELARLLKIPFYDLDQLIEERTGKSIRDLYLTGEELFRHEEAAAASALFSAHDNSIGHGLRNVIDQNYYTGVLAAGGGIIDNHDAMALLKKGSAKHCTVYLEISAETAWQRIVGLGELPPFLDAETQEASKEKHRLLHERRAVGYKRFAAFGIIAEGKSAARLAEELAARLVT